MIYNIGCGELSFNQIMHGTKCPACPYRVKIILIFFIIII